MTTQGYNQELLAALEAARKENQALKAATVKPTTKANDSKTVAAPKVAKVQVVVAAQRGGGIVGIKNDSKQVDGSVALTPELVAELKARNEAKGKLGKDAFNAKAPNGQVCTTPLSTTALRTIERKLAPLPKEHVKVVAWDQEQAVIDRAARAYGNSKCCYPKAPKEIEREQRMKAQAIKAAKGEVD